MAQKWCKHCGRQFDGEKSAKYCSLGCAVHSRVRAVGDGCHLWDGATAPGGYGSFRWNGRAYRANRAILICKTGIDPPELDAMHSCDTPGCCNEDHLSWGTHKQNMADRNERGRANMPKGERHHRAILTEAQVDQIKQMLGKVRQVDIAEQFGVPRSCIADISAGRSWR